MPVAQPTRLPRASLTAILPLTKVLQLRSHPHLCFGDFRGRHVRHRNGNQILLNSLFDERLQRPPLSVGKVSKLRYGLAPVLFGVR